MAALSTRLRLRVYPGAGGGAAIRRHGDAWKVRVGAPPEGGKANDAVVKLLAERLGVPRTRVKLVSGRAARDKIVELDGIDEGEAKRRLLA